MSDVIKIVPEDFDVAYSDLQNIKENLEEYKTALETSYETIQGNWKGNAANAFAEYATKVLSNYDGMMEDLHLLGEKIKTASETLQEVDAANANAM